jgi:pilus assembly protein Flp/PilA
MARSRLEPAACRLIDGARRLQTDRSGVAAIEFAMLGPPFLAMVCAIMAVGLQVLAQQTLDDAVDAAGRAVFTGQFQNAADGSDPTARLRALICAQPRAFNCSELQVEVTVGSTFAAGTARAAYDPKTGRMAADFGKSFTCPTGDQIVTVRAAVPVPRFYLPISVAGVRMADDRNLLTSTGVFRTEPYTQGSC